MMTMKIEKSVSRQTGLATIEMAIAIPVMLVMMLVITEFTRVFYQYNTLTKSVRDGSRYLSERVLQGLNEPTVTTEDMVVMKNLVVSGSPAGGTPLLPGLGFDDISVVIEQEGNGGSGRYYVNVKAEYAYVPIFGSIRGLGFVEDTDTSNFTLNAQSSMRAI